MKDLRPGEADLYLARKLPVSRPMSFSLTPRVESFLLLVLPMPSQPKPAHSGSISSNSSRSWGSWNFLQDFWHTSVTRNCLRLLNESCGSFGFHQSLPLFVLVGKLLSHHHEAWLERYWLRGVGHTWNTYQDLSGGRIGKKVVKIGDALKKRSYGAFYLVLQISRNLAYDGYLFWPFSVFPFSVLYQN